MEQAEITHINYTGVEYWKTIQGYEGIYMISSRGRVKSLHYGKEKLMKPSKNKIGYLIVGLRKDDQTKDTGRTRPQLFCRGRLFQNSCQNSQRGKETGRIL